MSTACKICETTPEARLGQWWNLNNYFGFSGNFCPDCYEKISHDSYKNPNHPNEYVMILLKFGN